MDSFKQKHTHSALHPHVRMALPWHQFHLRHLHGVSAFDFIFSYLTSVCEWHTFHMCSFVIVLICIFSAIENITSSKREIYQTDPYSGEKKKVLVPVWNPTLANLTLMAFGSSAPEIFLSVIETVTTLGAKPGELGPSTIVGSAAFNFLVISAVSILSVNVASDTRTDEEIKQDGTAKGIKKIDGLVVFGITTTWSIVAYIWLFLVL